MNLAQGLYISLQTLAIDIYLVREGSLASSTIVPILKSYLVYYCNHVLFPHIICSSQYQTQQILVIHLVKTSNKIP